MKNLQKLILTVFCSLIAVIGFAQKQEYSFKETYKASNSPTLKIQSNDGNVTVYGTDKNEFEVYYIVEKGNRLLEINRRELEEDVTVEVVSNSDRLEILVKQRYEYRIMDWRDRINVSFEIYAPRGTMSDLNCSDGNIYAKGLTADQDFRTSDGNVDIANIKGDVYAKTSDGNIDVNDNVGNMKLYTSDGNIDIDDVQGSITGKTSDGNVDIGGVDGDVDMVTSDGNIEADEVSGDMDLVTSDGDIRVSQSGGKMELRTSDGSISFRNISGSVKARTSDGNIRGNILNLKGELVLSTSEGSIDVALPGNLGLDLYIRAEDISTRLDNFSGTSKDHLIEGRLNGGGINVELTASDGSVRLSYE